MSTPTFNNASEAVADFPAKDSSAIVGQQQKSDAKFASVQAAGVQLTPSNILHICFGFMASKAALTAIGMGLFTVLGQKGPLTAEQIRLELKLNGRAVRDWLDALVSLNLLSRDEQERYNNTAETATFLDKNQPGYVGGLLEMCDYRLYRHWDNLGKGLRTGKAQNEAAQEDAEDFFGTIYSNPERLAVFLGAMTGFSRPANVAIAKMFDWSKYKTFVDAGAAQGDLVVQIAKHNPHLTGVGIDLPTVRPIFESYVEKHGLKDRVKFDSVDFFKAPLPKADVVTMGHILHDWNLDEKKKLIRAAYEALPPGGAFIAYDAMIDDARRVKTNGLLMSMNMLIETPGGFDYTGAEAKKWFAEAGFKNIYVQELNPQDSMIVGFK
jgi:SAM-dependent methyltransferase